MDNVDKKILALLQKDGKLSNAKLAEKLNMSETQRVTLLILFNVATMF